MRNNHGHEPSGFRIAFIGAAVRRARTVAEEGILVVALLGDENLSPPGSTATPSPQVSTGPAAGGKAEFTRTVNQDAFRQAAAYRVRILDAPGRDNVPGRENVYVTVRSPTTPGGG